MSRPKITLRESLRALTNAVRKTRERKLAKKADLREAAVRQYGSRKGIRIDEDVLDELCGQRDRVHFPEAIIATLETHDVDDYAAFALAFKENIETAETRAIIEAGIDKLVSDDDRR